MVMYQNSIWKSNDSTRFTYLETDPKKTGPAIHHRQIFSGGVSDQNENQVGRK